MKTQAQIAEALARKYHEGQFRHDNITPYITHIEGVVKIINNFFEKYGCGKCNGDNVVAAAWLHDILENCVITIQDLKDSGINDDVIAMVQVLTHDKEVDDYDTYFNKAIGYSFATLLIKYADMQYNINDNPSPKQLKKYAKALLVTSFNTYRFLNGIL